MKNFLIILVFLLFFSSYAQEDICITTFQGLKKQKQNIINLKTLVPTTYSFHFLLATVGRKSIFRMLNSLGPQLESQDFLTIVFDAKDVDNILEFVISKTKQFACKVKIVFEKKNLGFWGHGIRNKYAQSLEGDFIFHCDDDNRYLPNSISILRKICQDTNKLYFFKIKLGNSYIWKEPKIYRMNIDTGSGVIPNAYNKLGHWGYFYGADTTFYLDLCKKIENDNIIFVDFPIYQIRGS